VTPLSGTCIFDVSQTLASPCCRVLPSRYHSSVDCPHCVCSNLPPSARNLSQSARCLHSPEHPPNASNIPPTTSYTARYMVCRAGTLCHWACYEFGSAHIWVRLPFTWFTFPCAPSDEPGREDVTHPGRCYELQGEQQRLSMASLPVGNLESAIKHPIVVWLRRRGRQHRTVVI
jgi:hypothetical protein